MSSQLYILGPCSAESREQVLLTAGQLKALCGEKPFIFRAGTWKPRTSPHSFQGVGAEGLAWLAEVKQTYGIPVATEVATPEHVAAALEAGIDYLWIGARSSATPIVVQSLADSIVDFKLKNKDFNLKGILIKNPVNADAGLWIGNIERLEKTSVPVIAVHRGCNHAPCWSLAHAVRSARPDIPMLLDPSHMSGDADKVVGLMKMIDELGLNGAMVEVHCCPEEALSDAKQQIRPEVMSATLNDAAKLLNDEPAALNDVELNWLRAEIDELDEQLWSTIAARMEVSTRIGAWKKAHGVAPLQPDRYQQIVERLKARAESPEARQFMLQVWELIHAESLKRQD